MRRVEAPSTPELVLMYIIKILISISTTLTLILLTTIVLACLIKTKTISVRGYQNAFYPLGLILFNVVINFLFITFTKKKTVWFYIAIILVNIIFLALFILFTRLDYYSIFRALLQKYRIDL